MPIDPETIRATRNGVEPESFHEGVPNKDITEGFWKTLDKDVRDLLRRSKLYDVKTNDQVKADQPDTTDADLDDDTPVVPPAPEPQPIPATNEPQQVVSQQPDLNQPLDQPADDSGRIAPA